MLIGDLSIELYEFASRLEIRDFPHMPRRLLTICLTVALAAVLMPASADAVTDPAHDCPTTGTPGNESGGGLFTWRVVSCPELDNGATYASGEGRAQGSRVLGCVVYFNLWHNATHIWNTSRTCSAFDDSFFVGSILRPERNSSGWWIAPNPGVRVTVQTIMDVRYIATDGSIRVVREPAATYIYSYDGG